MKPNSRTSFREKSRSSRIVVSRDLAGRSTRSMCGLKQVAHRNQHSCDAQLCQGPSYYDVELWCVIAHRNRTRPRLILSPPIRHPAVSSSPGSSADSAARVSHVVRREILEKPLPRADGKAKAKDMRLSARRRDADAAAHSSSALLITTFGTDAAGAVTNAVWRGLSML